GQHVEDDHTPGKGSDLDIQAAQARAAGYDVFEFESDSMGKVYHFSEVSDSAVAIVAGAVAEVSGSGPQQLGVDIIGYSRGGGGMGEVGNALASEGILTNNMANLDGKLGSSNNRVTIPGVDLRLLRPEHWTPVQWGAPIVGLH